MSKDSSLSYIIVVFVLYVIVSGIFIFSMRKDIKELEIMEERQNTLHLITEQRLEDIEQRF